jgi:ABC-type transport system involved in cytochrome c biogenesis ATPase subunit
MRSSWVVAMANGAERDGKARAPSYLRQALVDKGHLIAVVDFPNVPRKRPRSAWVISPMSGIARDEVLMIDGSAFAPNRTHLEFGMGAEVAGRLFRLFAGLPLSGRWASAHFHDATADLRRFFEREFESGYRDVGGICRAVNRQEIRNSGYRLAAAPYVAERQSFLPEPGFAGINPGPIEVELDNRAPGKTIYVIGNNGEGKSLLLRRIALRSSQMSRPTVGISCSSTDRFPLPGERAKGFENFTYEGVRTSEEVADHHKLALNVSQKFSAIHGSAAQLPVFVELLRLIDFDAKRYLLPMSASKSGSDSEIMLRRIYELTDDVAKNQSTLRGIRSKSLQIALMRSGAGRDITNFLELSSGEQQIVSLVVKTLVHASQGCLILIDEPELSLHVSWQRVLPRVFDLIARRFKCDIVVATHSPLIISSVSDPDIVCFAASGGKLKPLSVQDRRSVESVLMTGFGTFTANNRQVHERCAAIVATAASEYGEGKLDAESMKPMLAELVEMRRKVQAALDKLDKEGIFRSLELIRSARETITKLGALAGGTEAKASEADQ